MNATTKRLLISCIVTAGMLGLSASSARAECCQNQSAIDVWNFGCDLEYTGCTIACVDNCCFGTCPNSDSCNDCYDDCGDQRNDCRGNGPDCVECQDMGEDCEIFSTWTANGSGGPGKCRDELSCYFLTLDASRCGPPTNDGELFDQNLCVGLYNKAWCFAQGTDPDQTLTFGVTAGAGCLTEVAVVEVGSIYGRDGIYGCYKTTCAGFVLDCGVSIGTTAGDFDLDFSGIAGESLALCLEVGTPFTGISSGVCDNFVEPEGCTDCCAELPDILEQDDGECESVGLVNSISTGFGLSPSPISVSVFECTTETIQVGTMDNWPGCDLLISTNQPPTCDAGGLYIAECNGSSTTTKVLDGTGSSDSEGALTYQWAANCPGGSFDDATAATPTLSLDSSCQSPCLVGLVVSDLDGATASCTAAIVVIDTTAPLIGTDASNSTVECDGSGNTAELNAWLGSQGGATATDACGSITWNDNFTALSDGCAATGSASVTFTATDDCGRSDSDCGDGFCSVTTATFTIDDSTNPTISCPANMFKESSAGQCSLGVTYPIAVSASDVCGAATISCVDQANNSVGTASDTFPVGTTTVTCTATDECSRTSNCSFDVVVNDPPVIVSVTPATQMVQYSDKIVPVVVTATDCGPGNSLTLEFDSLDVPNGLALSSTPDSCALNASNLVECTWTLGNNDRVLEPAGDYVIDGIKAVDPTQLNGVTLKSSPAETITIQVNAENATIAFDGSNPVAVQVATDGGDSGTFELKVAVQELNPEMASAGGNLPGDIGLAVMSMVLTPIGPGGGAVGTCTPDNDPNPLDYNGVLTVTCSFDNVGVNTYTMEAVLVANGAGNLFYTGSNEDVVVVFDPSLGFTTGGGHFVWPGTADRTSWGYTMRYNNNHNHVRGSLLLIRHLPDGSNFRIKSNRLFGLAIGDEGGQGWASFTGRCTYRDPSMDEPVGNHEFVTYVEDHGEPGAGVDRFWLQVFDKDDILVGDLSMDETAVSNAETIVGGNIVVPH